MRLTAMNPGGRYNTVTTVNTMIHRLSVVDFVASRKAVAFKSYLDVSGMERAASGRGLSGALLHLVDS